MKQRRAVIAIFLMVAILTLGIGYAGLTNVLDIQGTAKTTAEQADAAFEELVYFSETSSGTGYTSSINADNSDKASFTVTGLAKAGDKVTMTFTVSNESDLDAVVTLTTVEAGAHNPINTNSTYYKLTYKLGADGQGALPAKSGDTPGTLVITVEVELLVTPQQEITASFGIELVATSTSN